MPERTCLTISFYTAHNNVKVFISHGGQLSFTESIFHATPVLVLPVFGNQPRNAKFMEILGSGRILGWEELTADRIVDALIDLIHNPKFVLLYIYSCFLQ